MEPSSSNQIVPPVSPSPSADETRNKSARERREGARSIIKTILLLLAAPFLTVIITSFIFHSYEVFGPSQESKAPQNRPTKK